MGSRLLSCFGPSSPFTRFHAFSGADGHLYGHQNFIVFPPHILQFIIGDDIVSSEDRGRLVTGDWHDGEMVISSEPEIVNCAVTKIVKSEISQSRFRYGFIPLAFIVSWEGSDGFTTVEENAIGSDPSWKTLKHYSNSRMERDSSFKTCLRVFSLQPDKILKQINLIPG